MRIETVDQVLQLVLVGTIPLVVIGAFIQRLVSEKNIGVRVLQFTAVLTIIPATTLLSVRGLLGGETVAAIFAATVGYLLGNIAKFDDRRRVADR